MRQWTLITLASLVVGCGHHTMTLVESDTRYFSKQMAEEKSGVSITLGTVTDVRPRNQVEGADLRAGAGGDVLFLGWREFRRGTIYYPGRHTEPTVEDAFRMGLEKYLNQSGVNNPAADERYRVDVEIRHFTGINYQTHQGVAVLPLFGTNQVQFSQDYGLAVLGLRLYRADGSLVTETHVSRRDRHRNMRFYDTPDYEARQEELVSLMSVTVEKSLRVLAGLAAADLQRRAPELAKTLVDPMTRLKDEGEFMIHRVIQDRGRSEVAFVDVQTGEIKRTSTAYFHNLGGTPGHWYLSTQNMVGVRMPRPVYRDLVNALSDRFILQRGDDLMLYGYFGPRTPGK